MKRRCEGTALVRAGHPYSRCLLAGSLEHDGHWYCKRHHPPAVEEYEKERHERWEAKWAEQDKARAAAKREQTLKDRALEWMRRENPRVVKEWEEELCLKEKTLGEVAVEASNAYETEMGQGWIQGEYFDFIAAAVVAEHERRKWKPMEDAPKDKPLFGRGKYTFEPLNGQADEIHYYEMKWAEGWGQWLDPNGNAVSPTHWQYAPEGPKP